MNTERFAEAFRYAAGLHANQLRKGTTTPYISHLMAVAAAVLEHGGNEDEIVAAQLHDAIEDQPQGSLTRRQIRERFGPHVLALVGYVLQERWEIGRKDDPEVVLPVKAVAVCSERVTKALVRPAGKRG